jgi:hypothetical protein
MKAPSRHRQQMLIQLSGWIPVKENKHMDLVLEERLLCLDIYIVKLNPGASSNKLLKYAKDMIG